MLHPLTIIAFAFILSSYGGSHSTAPTPNGNTRELKYNASFHYLWNGSVPSLNSYVIAAIGRCMAVLLQSRTMRTRLMQQHPDFIDVTMRLWLLYSDHSDACAALASMYGSFTSLCTPETIANVESAGAVPVIVRALGNADSKMAALAANGVDASGDDALAYTEDVLCCIRYSTT